MRKALRITAPRSTRDMGDKRECSGGPSSSTHHHDLFQGFEHTRRRHPKRLAEHAAEMR